MPMRFIVDICFAAARPRQQSRLAHKREDLGEKIDQLVLAL
jgi:hypothetical protein